MMNNENGRSMVEMLGVLAIIGVLSVAGIAGYTIAMRKHKANEIAEAISMLAIAAKTANGGSGTEATQADPDTYNDLLNRNNPSGVEALGAYADDGKIYVKAVMNDEKLCKEVANNFGPSNESLSIASGEGSNTCGSTDNLIIVTK